MGWALLAGLSFIPFFFLPFLLYIPWIVAGPPLYEQYSIIYALHDIICESVILLFAVAALEML